MGIQKKIRKKIKNKAGAKVTGDKKYIFQLFVTGMLPNSAYAILNITNICDKYLKGRYELEIIDIYEEPGMALSEGIIAIPVLIKKLPLPEERIIGDLSNIERVLNGLHLDKLLPD